MKDQLKKLCKELNIEYVGIADIGPYYELENRLMDRKNKGYMTGMEEDDLKKRIDPKETMEDVKSIIVCLFPYFIGTFQDSNISKYTYSTDYHMVGKEKLEEIGQFFKEKIEGFSYETFVDTGPLVDRYLAYLSGLGYFGTNNNIINEKYGSYVFIGYILNNYSFEKDQPLNQSCIGCGACIKACPGNAILGNFEINPRNCLSFITQKKDLSQEEVDVLKKNNMVFGCDICQDVCPHNKNIAYTNIKEFKEDLTYNLKEEEISNLSNKAFKKKYKKKAFSWRGKKNILRNIQVLSNK